MDNIILAFKILLIFLYVCVAIWVICKRKSIGGTIGASVGFTCGGFVIIPVAEAIATFVCWSVVIGIVICVIAAILGG